MPRWIFLPILFFIVSFPTLRAQGSDGFFLLVENQEACQVLLKLPVQPGECFRYEYVHSSDHTPVRDTFRVDGRGKMTLLEEAFLWPGAGLEFQGHGETRLSFAGPWTRVQLNRGFSQLPIRVGRVAQQILAVRSQIYRLDELAKPGDRLILSISD